MLAIVIVCILTGLLLTGLSIPLVRGKVKPNQWYGFRIQLTLDNPGIWYPANAWAGRRLFVVGVGIIAATLLGFLIPEAWLPAYFLIIALLLVVSVLLITVLGVRYARSLADADEGKT